MRTGESGGGYKLGSGDKAPIRFDGDSLPIIRPNLGAKPPLAVKPTSKRVGKKRRRSDLLADAPRLVQPLDGIA